MTTLSTQAQTAKEIRKLLKQKFPETKFKVVSSSFAGGNSVDIFWHNGPTYKQITTITRIFEYGTFDGMTDCYNCDNIRNDMPQVKYVCAARTISNETYTKCFEWAKNVFIELAQLKDINDSIYTPAGYQNGHGYIWRFLSDKDLTNFDGNFDELLKMEGANQ